jgi:hypothetical protein
MLALIMIALFNTAFIPCRRESAVVIALYYTEFRDNIGRSMPSRVRSTADYNVPSM